MPLNLTDSKVALAGDWHHNAAWAESALRVIADHGVHTVYHMGDFGIFPDVHGRDWYLERVHNICHKLDITIYVTPGNHEDWDWLSKRFAASAALTPQSIPPSIAGQERLWVLPRGYRWTHAGRSLISLGGAPSIDYEWRSTGRNWWIDETISREVAQAVAEAGHAEIMFAHDAPNSSPVVQRALRRPTGYSAEALTYAAIGRSRIDAAIAGVRPMLYCHGHYHAPDESTLEDETRLLSLGQDGQAGNLVVLDLAADDFGVQWLDDPAAYPPVRRSLNPEHDYLARPEE
ncbi:metallophosphoesterase [Paramicrobacterium fandaimingii]|uniref:metallophosphoesterase n=1 Tax=Paramicrobacterium fandaimingii TaxID=2708079 RepID=UPI00141F3E77|nr:metallophosphoesterase [Microbacterium fandaimingii]